MKQRFITLALILLSVSLLLTGCGGSEKEAPVNGSSTMAEDSEFDVDLTALSSTMVYAEVYNMMTAPDDYIGKQVKMAGQFTIYQTIIDGQIDPDLVYFACVVADATACCSQGIEFEWSGEHTYPEDYPELGSQITVSGEFHTYKENGFTYCYLRDAEVSF